MTIIYHSVHRYTVIKNGAVVSEGVKNSADVPRLTGSVLASVARLIMTRDTIPIFHSFSGPGGC